MPLLRRIASPGRMDSHRRIYSFNRIDSFRRIDSYVIIDGSDIQIIRIDCVKFVLNTTTQLITIYLYIPYNILIESI